MDIIVSNTLVLLAGLTLVVAMTTPVTNGTTASTMSGSQTTSITSTTQTTLMTSNSTQTTNGTSMQTTTVQPTAPGSAPRNVRARWDSPQTIMIEWDEPEIPNGIIQGYKVFYTTQPELPIVLWDSEIHNDSRMATITNLDPDKNYTISVLAFSRMGQGPLSPPIQVIARQGVNSSTATTDTMTTMTTSNPVNCSYPGQECQNGTCLPVTGKCNCFQSFTGIQCETYMDCPQDYCVRNGTENCTVLGTGMYNCSCLQGYSGHRCQMFDGCMSDPCENNGTCVTRGRYGGYTCTCLTGDPTRNCRLNEENECYLTPPNSVLSYITCVDLIGERRLYCAPGYNGTNCLDKVPDVDYCTRHGCLTSNYCKPLCNVPMCNTTDVCSTFTALTNLRATVLYDLTECSWKFADGFIHRECMGEMGLFDGFDSARESLRDCSPFFNTICTSRFGDGTCDDQCNNTDCLYDGGDCAAPNVNGSGVLPGLTVVRFSDLRYPNRALETRLSLFARAKVQAHFSMDRLQAGLTISDSNFSDITIASKFFAVAIGKVPGLLDMVTDVYACKHGMYNNGSGSECDTNCSRTCHQSGMICHWSNGECVNGCQRNHWGKYCENTCHMGCNGTCLQMDGHCVQCPVGNYGAACQMDCDQHCEGSECHIRSGHCNCTTGYFWSTDHCMACSKNCKGGLCTHYGLCTNGCMTGYYGNGCTKACSANCNGGSCSFTGQCTGDCMSGYYGNMCTKSCSENCKSGSCSTTGQCSGDCMSGYHGDMCQQMCPPKCLECRKDTGECMKALMEDDDNNTGVIIAIVIAIIIILIIIIIAICCWRCKQSGDYILEDEEMECPVGKAGTLEVKTTMSLQPVSPYMGRSTDMIDMDERQQTTAVYAGPHVSVIDRNPDGKSTSSDEGKSKRGSSDSGDDAPATGVGAPSGRKRSSLKITLSREKEPAGEMSQKSPRLLVVNDRTGEILSPLKIDYPEMSAFVMPETSLKHTMAPLASEEDLLAGVGAKESPEPGDDKDNTPPPLDNIGPIPDEEDEVDKKSKRSSSSSSKRSNSSSEGKASNRSSKVSEGNNSKRSSKGSEGKESKKSRSRSSSSSSSSGSDDEELKQYDENKDEITEM